MFLFKSVQYDKMQESASSKGRNSYLLLGNYGDSKGLASSKYFGWYVLIHKFPFFVLPFHNFSFVKVIFERFCESLSRSIYLFKPFVNDVKKHHIILQILQDF